jgi:hypothetical protein
MCSHELQNLHVQWQIVHLVVLPARLPSRLPRLMSVVPAVMIMVEFRRASALSC